ncbi:MAG: hypothetical protein J4G06_05050 [Caldilineaceae bacterium]|nr:hypothetical protein [Caldilineaceae bacterium]
MATEEEFLAGALALVDFALVLAPDTLFLAPSLAFPPDADDFLDDALTLAFVPVPLAARRVRDPAVRFRAAFGLALGVAVSTAGSVSGRAAVLSVSAIFAVCWGAYGTALY